MKKILIVEDSEMVMRVLRHLIHNTLPYEAFYAASLAQAKLLCEEGHEFFAALVDLNLPDAPDGEVVDLTLGKKIPTIVLTGSYDEQRREQLFSKGIVDYVTKEGRYAYSKAVSLFQRLEKNQQIKVLVVDDSDMSRKHVANLLRRHLFQVLESVDGMEAIKTMLDHPDIKLLITDYNMPRMDGFELVKNLRYKYDKTGLIMIGVSGESSEALSAKFIKHGANDFLRKPFHPEEFYCRIIHNLELLEQVELLDYHADRDPLTGLYHRSYFFHHAQELANQARDKSTPLALAVLNIDDFAEVNQRFGNQGGDQVLQHVAELLQQMLGRFLLCRAGGDEFFVLLPGLDNDKAVALISKVRQLVATEPVTVQNQTFSSNFSAGVTNRLCSNIDEQLNQATRFLKLAKESSGGMVVGDDEEVTD
jgi:diguanylate cyclase (GGDEF) domain